MPVGSAGGISCGCIAQHNLSRQQPDGTHHRGDDLARILVLEVYEHQGVGQDSMDMNGNMVPSKPPPLLVIWSDRVPNGRGEDYMNYVRKNGGTVTTVDWVNPNTHHLCRLYAWQLHWIEDPLIPATSHRQIYNENQAKREAQRVQTNRLFSSPF